MSETQILENLKNEFEAAPKSSAGFVNHRRAYNMAWKTAQELFSVGLSREDAFEKIYRIWKPYDTHFSKWSRDPEFSSLSYPFFSPPICSLA